MSLLVLIRISGMVNRSADVRDTLDKLKLRRKYVCTLVDSDKKEVMGMVKKIRSFISYGEIDKETLSELIKVRGETLPAEKGKGKIDNEKLAEMLLKNKTFEKSGIKPFFRLHPPRGGINTKDHFPQGVLGENKKINELIKRML